MKVLGHTIEPQIVGVDFSRGKDKTIKLYGHKDEKGHLVVDRIEEIEPDEASTVGYADEPPPQDGQLMVYPYVLDDLQQRVLAGIERYGRPLETRNGRDALVDAYQEALDLVLYLRQAILERDGQ